jgi:hypothetical protein
VTEAAEIGGALAVLAAFVASQMQILGTQTLTYLVLNFAGSFTLAAIAWDQRQWGFLLLEGAWAAVSAGAFSRQVRTTVKESRSLRVPHTDLDEGSGVHARNAAPPRDFR